MLLQEYSLLSYMADTIGRSKDGHLEDLQSRSRVFPISEEIKAIIHHAEAENLKISFCQVPGHVCVVGNEMAAAVAKEAAISVNNPIFG